MVALPLSRVSLLLKSQNQNFRISIARNTPNEFVVYLDQNSRQQGFIDFKTSAMNMCGLNELEKFVARRTRCNACFYKPATFSHRKELRLSSFDKKLRLSFWLPFYAKSMYVQEGCEILDHFLTGCSVSSDLIPLYQLTIST